MRRAVIARELPLLAQIAGEEDDHADLRHLGRLKGQRPEVDAQVGAVHLGADPRQARRHQQQDPDRSDQVPVALQDVVVAKEQDRGRQHGRSADEDRRLLQGQLLVDPEQHHQSDRGQERAEREQVRVGMGEPGPDEQVDAEADGQEVAAVDQAQVTDPVRLDDEHRREPTGDQQGDRKQREELAVAGAHCPPPPEPPPWAEPPPPAPPSPAFRFPSVRFDLRTGGSAAS